MNLLDVNEGSKRETSSSQAQDNDVHMDLPRTNGHFVLPSLKRRTCVSSVASAGETWAPLGSQFAPHILYPGDFFFFFFGRGAEIISLQVIGNLI